MKTTAALAIVGLFLAGCERKPDTSAVRGKLSGQNLLLITLDTTRADRLGCYGYKPAETPTLDALAARGTLFENAFAQVPLTLPSHCSIMTGRYPREHGVRDNGRNALGPGHVTLATLAKEHGYQTAAFVASFVLDSRFGLDRGFDTYSDDMDKVGFDVEPLEWQQPGNVITDRALTWLNAAKGRPFFCWVHYFDPHLPYLPPEPFRRPDVHPYVTEIEFMDTQVKRLSDWLASTGLLERTLVVVVGDHGEGLGEHVEEGHSNFVYRTNVHIPMFFAHPAVVQRGKRVPATVESVDVFSTVLDLFGWQGPPKLMSRSLAPALAGRDIESVSAYSESLCVFSSFGWAEQRAITTDRWRYISSAKPELFDRRSDPGETKNLIADEPRRAAALVKELRNRYDAMTPGEAAVAEWDSAARAALEQLGYLGGSTNTIEEFVSPGLPDPKDMYDVLLLFNTAKEYLAEHEKPEDVAAILPLVKHVVEQSPNSLIFQSLLGICYVRAHLWDDALAPLAEAIRIDPRHTAALTLRGDALAELNRLDEALSHYHAALAVEGRSAEIHGGLAYVLHKWGRLDEAVKRYETALELFPRYALVHGRLGAALLAQGKIAEAVPHLEEALRLTPHSPESHYNLGLSFLQTGRFSEAAAHFQEAVRLKPDYGEALLNFGVAQWMQGDSSAAKEAFTGAMSIPQVAAEARYHLGVVLAREGSTEETVKLYEQAVALKPTYVNAIVELSKFYLASGRSPDAVRILRIGAANVPDHVPILELLARVLATSHDDAVRDGATALTLAERASRLTGGREPVLQATLAAACAETGDFERAVAVARQALELASAAGSIQKKAAEVIPLQIDGYLQRKPYRDPRF